MKCSTKTNVLRVLNLLVILGLCWWIKTKNDKTKEMIQWNTKIIHSIGVVSFTQAQNADVLLDIIAEMDKENYGTPGGVFASFEEDPRPIPQEQPMPEGMEQSYIQQSYSEFKTDKDGNEIVSATFDQVIEDLKRIDLSVRAFASNNLFQKQSLDLIYKRLTEGDIKLQKIEEEGQEIYYIIQEDRYDDEPVKEVSQEDLDDFEWSFIPFYGAENES
tara:strand:- start:62 stop:712 length:651 start_codon:yes stop_codon:yes gene_type:complete